MIKKIITSIAFVLGRLSCFIYFPRFAVKVENFFHVLNSGRIAFQLKEVGSGLEIRYPAYILGAKYISIGMNFRTLRRLKMEAWDSYLGAKFSPSIDIGDNVSFSDSCHIGAIGYIKIGNNVLLGSNVYITDHFHGTVDFEEMRIPPLKRPLFYKGEVIIEDDVWIGEGVCVMPNVILGKGCIVGANAVVTKSFPPYSIIGGCPAHLIQKR